MSPICAMLQTGERTLKDMGARGRFDRAWVLSLLCGFATVAGGQAAPTPPAQPGAVPQQSVVGEQYLIGPGDTLQVFVWRNPDLSVTVPVRPDGRISTPLVENMTAVGKTPSQLARDMEHVLSEFVRSPQVNIIVTNAVSTLSEVKVVGQVKQPKAVPYHEGMKVLDVLLAVGGMTEYASGNRAKIVRAAGGKTQEIRVRLDDLLNKGDIRQNLPVEPGDVLLVPESLF